MFPIFTKYFNYSIEIKDLYLFFIYFYLSSYLFPIDIIKPNSKIEYRMSYIQ